MKVHKAKNWTVKITDPRRRWSVEEDEDFEDVPYTFVRYTLLFSNQVNNNFSKGDTMAQ